MDTEDEESSTSLDLASNAKKEQYEFDEETLFDPMILCVPDP